MKCEVCLARLEEFFDGELAAADSAQVEAHLLTCADCARGFARLRTEQDLFARYDREIEPPPFMWTRIAAQTVSEESEAKPTWRRILAQMFATPVAAGALALLGIAIVIRLAISGGVPPENSSADQGDRRVAVKGSPKSDPAQTSNAPDVQDTRESTPRRRTPRPTKAIVSRPVPAQSDVLSSDLGYLDMDDRDTAKHIEQTQLLLRSIRNVAIAEGEDEIDVSYDKALSRRLLNENVVLRRDAEMKAKFPTKTLLSDLEPFLIDIANLPDRASAEEVRVIKERVNKTEIVAALLDYQQRGANNR